jgi:hypothetical protein
MAQFIHLFDERFAASIKRSGLRVARSKQRVKKGVFVQALTESFQITHQWMRELRRRQGISLLAARIRIADDELVLLGRYNEKHLRCTAAEAVGIARSHQDPIGLEIIILRPIKAREIESYYRPPKVVGWRYYPGARGRRPCGCPYCQRGEPYGRRIRDEYDQS